MPAHGVPWPCQEGIFLVIQRSREDNKIGALLSLKCALRKKTNKVSRWVHVTHLRDAPKQVNAALDSTRFSYSEKNNQRQQSQFVIAFFRAFLVHILPPSRLRIYRRGLEVTTSKIRGRYGFVHVVIFYIVCTIQSNSFEKTT